MADKKKPIEITDKDLDNVSGGATPKLQESISVGTVYKETKLSSGDALKLKTSPAQLRARDNATK